MVSARERLCCSPVSNRAYRSISEAIVRPTATTGFGALKCTHLYHYYQHPEFGLMHVRVQNWFPFTVDICLNGRQWLAHQMDQAGIAYRQCDNCFVWVEDFVEAQKLLDHQLQSDWPALLQKLLILAHPLQEEITAAMRGLSYYWSASQTEYATDIVFDNAKSLQRLYPHFLLHGIRSFQSPDVLRFLGKPEGVRFAPYRQWELTQDVR